MKQILDKAAYVIVWCVAFAFALAAIVVIYHDPKVPVFVLVAGLFFWSALRIADIEVSAKMEKETAWNIHDLNGGVPVSADELIEVLTRDSTNQTGDPELGFADDFDWTKVIAWRKA